MMTMVRLMTKNTVKPMDINMSATEEQIRDVFNENENKENKKMKKVTFKNKFNSLDEALTKVPQTLKEDKNVFEMTDGNQTIKVRWEGSLTEGVAVPLLNVNEIKINEDMNHMKHLMGYTSEPTLGAVKGKGRVNENDTFKELLKVKKKD